MKFKRISQDDAEKIIVYGNGSGFSIVKIGDTNYTIYHRVYKDKFYNVGQMSVYDDENDRSIYVFYIFDNDDVRAMLGINPEDDIRADISKERLVNVNE